MQPTGEVKAGLTAVDAADFTAELLGDLAEIARTAGLRQSADVIGVAINVIRLESTSASERAG